MPLMIGLHNFFLEMSKKVGQDSVSGIVLLRPKNFVRHFQGTDIKCKLPLSTNNLAFYRYCHFDNLSFSPSVQIL
jgi:hypothetical protein